MIYIKNYNFFLIFMLLNIQITSNDFNHIWTDMQTKYNKCINKLNNEFNDDFKDKFHTQYWKSLKEIAKKLIEDTANINFLKNHEIACSMIRGLNGEFNNEQAFEQAYLNYCLSEKNKNKILKFCDTDLLPITSKIFNCSTNSLGHLFYVAKILENLNSLEPKIIVELGAGYGNFARILKQIFNKSTIILFDLPEFCAIQYLFLSHTLPQTKIIFHNSHINNQLLEAASINIVPIYYLEQCDLKSDIFISTFALTETPEFVQKLIIEKDFFKSTINYITGQLNGWNENGFSFIKHENIFKAIRKRYKKVNCVPFHIFNPNQISFEMISQNN